MRVNVRFIAILRVLAATLGAPLHGGDCVVVGGGQIHLQDIATSGTETGEPVWDRVIGAAPAPGTTRWFSREQRGALLRPARINEDPASGICIQSATRTLNNEMIEKAMRKTSGGGGVVLEVVDFSRYPIPAGELEFPASTLPRNPSRTDSPVLWRGYVRVSGAQTIAVWARVRISVEELVPVARRAISGGRTIEADDVVFETRRIFPRVRSATGVPLQPVGCVARGGIPAGAIVEARMIVAAPTVVHGRILQAELRSGPVQLKLAAIAESDGRSGDVIWLHALSGGKRFRGKVEGPDNVVVVQERK